MLPSYIRLTWEVGAEREEELSAALWLAGTAGIETRGEGPRLHLEAWFTAEAARHLDPPALAAAVAGAYLGAAAQPPTDYLAAYRAASRPFAVASRFFVDPREPDADLAEAPAGRFLLRLPARQAFGVGSHESTSLALELLERRNPSSRRGPVRLLDVGTGTGILSFAAAALLGEAGLALSAVAYDFDPIAAFAARDNAALNRDLLTGHELHVFAGTIAALGASERFDLVLANVLPEEIAAELPAIVATLRPGGELILSGILAERGEEILARTAALGLAPVDRAEQNEWVAFCLRRASEAP